MADKKVDLLCSLPEGWPSKTPTIEQVLRLFENQNKHALYDAGRLVRQFADPLTPVQSKNTSLALDTGRHLRPRQLTQPASEANYLKACLAWQKTFPDRDLNGPGSDPDTDLAKKTENPIADLISVPFNNYSTFNYGGRGTFNLLEIQPVIPIHLTPDWNVITRLFPWFGPRTCRLSRACRQASHRPTFPPS